MASMEENEEVRNNVAGIPVSGTTARNPSGERAKWLSTPHQSDVLREYTGVRFALYGQIYSEERGRSSILRGRQVWATAKRDNADGISAYSTMRDRPDAFGSRI